MNEEEYNEVICKVNSDDILERMNALILLSIFPKYDKNTTIEYTEDGVGSVESKIRSVLGGFCE